MDFKSALNRICKDFDKDIIFDKKVISILDDYGAFKDVPYYKLFYKTTLSLGNLMNLISLDNNKRYKEIFTFVSLTGLDEEKTKSFLSLIYECYHGVLLIPDSNCEHKVKYSDNNGSSKDGNSTKLTETSSKKKEAHILFMGKELGCPVQEMIDYLIRKGFSRLYKLGHPKVKGNFAGVKDVTMTIWPTDSNKVWSVVINLKSDFNFLKELFKSKYPNFRKEMNNRTYTERLIFTTNGGEIKLSKEISDIRINYIDTITYELHNKEQKQKNELRRKQEEISLRQQINKGLTDI